MLSMSTRPPNEGQVLAEQVEAAQAAFLDELLSGGDPEAVFNTMKLKYLFTAECDDGTSFSRTEEDVSSCRSQPICLLRRASVQKRVKRFSLTGSGQTWTVDLTDGHFEHNGIPFLAESDPLPIARDLRLIFYRQHRHHFNPKTNAELSHEVTYVIGWQTTVAGRNYQQKVGVA